MNQFLLGFCLIALSNLEVFGKLGEIIKTFVSSLVSLTQATGFTWLDEKAKLKNLVTLSHYQVGRDSAAVRGG